MFFSRTTSGRISSRSSSVTPKIPAKVSLHNSADLHNTSASSGSHVLDQSTASQPYANDLGVDQADVHSDSSLSVSRSLNSPKLDRSQRETSEPSEGQMLVSKEGDHEVAVVTAQQTPEKEKGACNYDNFTNMYNINTNLDEVEVNDSYLNALGNSNILSANQNKLDTEPSQSQASCQSESYDAEVEPTTSISLPSDLKGSSIDQSDSVSYQSDIKGHAGIDQTDQSIISDLSADEMADIESCLQTISSAGYEDLESLVENVVEPLLGVAKTAVALTDDLQTDSKVVSSEIKISEGAIIEGNTAIGEWVNELQLQNSNNETDISNAGKVATENITDVKHRAFEPEINLEDSMQNFSDVAEKSSVKNIEPSSCILAAVESQLSKEGNLTDTVDIDNDFVDVTVPSKGDDSDMFEDIPYFLHRRHIIGDKERKKETELYTALINALNSNQSSQTRSSNSKAQARRSRSMRRAPNMQIEQLKADEIPYQPRSLSLPSKRPASKSPGPQSPTQSEAGKPERNRSHSRRTGSRSSQSRSPSGNRMIEVVKFHDLPRRDNYSSVDDTTSPTEEIDILSQYFWHRTRSPGFRSESASLSENISKHDSSYIQPSPITDLSLDEGLLQNTSESDSLRGLSETSFSLTHSSMSINESETSQGSYSLSDLNLSKDDIVNELRRVESLDGDNQTGKIKIEDLDLPFIDAFDESDISENQLANFQMSNTQHFIDSSLSVKHDSVDDNEEMSQSEDGGQITQQDDKCVIRNIESEEYFDLTRSVDEVDMLRLENEEIENSDILPKLPKSNKPVLKPLEIPMKPFINKSQADDEWQLLLKQLKDDDPSPEDLNPNDLLMSLRDERSRLKTSHSRKPVSAEESEIEELDQLLLETTKFKGPDKRDYEYFDQVESNFSTFKPTESPSRAAKLENRRLLHGMRGSVVRVSLSHDVEDIHLEDKPIGLYRLQTEEMSSSSSLSSPKHAIIRRSPSPSRLLEYTTRGHKEYIVKGDSVEKDEDIETDLSKRHSYPKDSRSNSDAETKRKQFEPKRVSFHETVEEITTEAYQTSSSSSDDKSGGHNDSDIGSPDTFVSTTTSELNYDPDDSSPGSQYVGFDSETDVSKSVKRSGSDLNSTSGENTSDEDEIADKDAEFLKFAESLSECGKDGAADSGVGDSMTNTTEVSPSEPADNGENNERNGDSDDGKVDDIGRIRYTGNVKINGKSGVITQHLDASSPQSYDESSSSTDSDLGLPKKDKRPSIDPLESLEQLHDSYVSSSDESFEEEQNVVTTN